MPDGLSVNVVPAAGGGSLKVDDVPGTLFTFSSGGTGHEPFAKVKLPSAGSYVVETTTPEGISGGLITVGKRPWTPLGAPPIVGALLILGLFGALAAGLPAKLLRKRGPA